MFTDSLIDSLEQENVRLLAVTDGHTPFPLWQLAGTQTFLHGIDIGTYRQQPSAVGHPAFFRDVTDRYAAAGGRLIHLWEDVWRQKPAVVLSRLKALAGASQRIPARLTAVRRIDRPTTAAFLETHHLQVVTQSKYKYGLFLPARYYRVLADDYRNTLEPGSGELLVAVATFSHPRTIPREGRPLRSVELVRFANRLGCTVVGGLDKLLKAFITEHRPDDIMTYADRDWSDGRSYQTLGFQRISVTEPQAFWLDPALLTRYYPHRLPEPVNEADLIRIYNAGSIKFVRTLLPLTD